MANKKGFVAEIKTKWEVPEISDARVLTMPNIPHPLQGKGYQPRTLLRPSEWNYMRKACYAKAGYQCEACGDTPEKGKLHAHELFNTNYETGEHRFVRLVALCSTCHVAFVHSGRALTLYKQGSPLMPRDFLLAGVEKGFKAISDWNKAHPDEEPVYPFAAFLDYLETPDIQQEMEHLVKKYNMKFWSIPKAKKQCKWDDWHLVFNGKEYYTQYEDMKDYEQKMDEKNKKDNVSFNLTGGIFDEIDNLIKENNNGK